MALSAFLFALSCLVWASREGMFSLGWTTARLRHIRSDGGFAYNAPTHHPELSEEREPSSGVVLEDGIPLPGQADANHDDIRKMGKGRTSFWGSHVHFSTSDNSSPGANGRTYEIRFPRYVTDPFAFALYGCTVLLFWASVWFAARTPEIRGPIARALSARAGPLFFALVGLSVLSTAFSYATCMNRQGLLSLGWRTDPLPKLRHEAGFAYLALTHNRDLGEGTEPSLGVVLEDGAPLPGYDNAQHVDIREIGKGRSSFWSDLVYFSSSDNSPPTGNGRSYAIRYPRMVRSTFANAIYAFTIVLIAASIWLARRTPEPRRSIGRAASFSIGPQFYSLVTLSLSLFLLSCAIHANRDGMLFLGWKTDALAHIHPKGGFAFRAPTLHPELSAEDRPPAGVVLEDGVPLPGASNASHEEIRKLGKGRYSFWGGSVYFSASDNTSPGLNGRAYALRYPRTVGTAAAVAVYSSTLLLLGASIWFVSRTPDLIRLARHAVSRSVRPPYYALLVLTALSLVLSYAAFSNRWGMFPLGWAKDPLTNIHPEGGFAYGAPTYNPDIGPDSEPYTSLVLEDGVPLPGPASARHEDIRELGNGRYSSWNQIVFFSASDNGPAAANGRSYEIRYPRMVGRSVAFALYACTLLLAAASIILGRKSPELVSATGRIASRLAGPPFHALARLLLVLCVLSFAACLSWQGALPFASKTDALRNIQHERGFAYSAPTYHPELGVEEVPTPGMVLENGAPLPGGTDARLTDIRDLGRGRSLFSGADVYFSASDNSAPGANGRAYEVRYPWAASGTTVFTLCAATIFLGTVLAWVVRKSPERLLQVTRAASCFLAPPFYVPAAIVLFFYLLARLPFFFYYPIVGIGVDSESYLSLVRAIRNGIWPHFQYRTPAYPLVLWPFTFLADRWMAVVCFQNLLSLSSALCLVYATYRLRRYLALPAAIAMGAFVAGSQVLIFDTSILSESLYTSSIILAVAFLFLAFAGCARAFFALASAAMALTILVRPAGMFFAVIYGLVLAYMLWNHYQKGAIFRFLAPFPAVLLVFSSYNYFTLGSFVVSPFGEANLAGATVLYWEPDPSYPGFINKALKELPASCEKAGITQEDIKQLRESWDPIVLVRIYDRAYNSMVWNAGWGTGLAFGTRGYLYYRQYIRQLSMAAIRKHPVLYAKRIWANLAVFYFTDMDYHYEFYSALKDRVRDEFVAKIPDYNVMLSGKGHVPPPVPSAIQIVGADGEQDAVLTPHMLKRAHVAWERAHWRFFMSTYWVWGYFVVLALSLAQLLRFRGRHLGAFLLFILTLVALGAGLVISLVEIAMNRYSCPTQFVFYLTVAAAPLLWSRAKSCSQNCPSQQRVHDADFKRNTG
jgi:hypothetical protein